MLRHKTLVVNLMGLGFRVLAREAPPPYIAASAQKGYLGGKLTSQNVYQRISVSNSTYGAKYTETFCKQEI